MSLILVMSDTHRELGPVRKLLELYSGRAAAAVHLGDHMDDMLCCGDEFPGFTMYAVAGNCDGAARGYGEHVIDIEGKKILLTHGHKYISFNADKLKLRAEELGADVCLFGHTHIQAAFMSGGLYFMNPGSLSRPRGGSRPGYGLLKVCTGGAVKGTLICV